MSSAKADTPATAPPLAPPACAASAYADFNFWLGAWTVYGGKDGTKVLGHNRIERSASGCWLTEHWRSASGPGNDGTSLNVWDAPYRVWRQFWTGADGTVLRLTGGIRDGSMVMTGELPGSDATVQQQRITWTPNADGTVTQHWETSDDAGKNWKTSFLGQYRREASADAVQ